MSIAPLSELDKVERRSRRLGGRPLRLCGEKTKELTYV